jgi:hypothetical protein
MRPRGKPLLENCRPFFETEFLSGHIATNVYVYAVRGIGGLKNEAQRNVKPDHLQTVHRYRTKLRKYF